MQLFTLCKGDFNFEESIIREIGFHWNDSEPRFCLLSLELPNLPFMQEQPSHAQGLMVKDLRGEIPRGDVDVMQVQLALLHAGIPIAKVDLAGTRGLYLRSEKLNAAFVSFQKLVAEPRLPVDDCRGKALATVLGGLCHGYEWYARRVGRWKRAC